MTTLLNKKGEWLETDGLGGFASGTIDGIRTRRYHALLLTAQTPPTGRVVLVNGFDSWLDTPAGTFSLSSQRYAPDAVSPDGARRIEDFEPEPWPRWRFRLEDGLQVEQELFVPKGAPAVVLAWRLCGQHANVRLGVRPFLSGRDYHALFHQNPAFRFDAGVQKGRVVWQPYAGLPAVVALTNGAYVHRPDWYRNFLYLEEQARGLDCTEDLASPGYFLWDLSGGEAVCILTVQDSETQQQPTGLPPKGSAEEMCQKLRKDERRRRGLFPTRLHRAADAYIVRRGKGKSIVAGYPWFTDWGRDTFIALRGLCLAGARADDARAILLAWAGAVSEGMLPNRFPDRGESPEFNAVDASLWYAIAVHDFLQTLKRKKKPASWKISQRDQKTLWETVDAILDGYCRGTRFGIHLDDDGLIAAGVPGVQLTWMDAMVNGQVVSPRIGKPVEVQALWLNALWIRRLASKRWASLFKKGLDSFRKRFWNNAGGCLFDVIDCDSQAGTADATFRPNQIFAVGGLPIALLENPRARRVVKAVEDRLWTPLGPRSLAPGEPKYSPRYEGGVWQRDHAYHEGTVWPWLSGPFVEAWVRVRGNTAKAKQEARRRFLEPLLQHLDEAGLGHLPEIADGDPPHAPRGCPFQAWSVGEALRLAQCVLSAHSR